MSSLVSILIPTLNRADLLEETLRSIRAQTHEHWEAIVVDDHSVDGTARVLEIAHAEDPRIQPHLRVGNRPGAQGCRNQALANSRGEYVLFLDSDDLLGPTCLEERLNVLAGDPELDFVVFQAALFVNSPTDARWLWNKFTDRSDLERFLDLDAPWGICNVLWRRPCLEALGELDESLPRYQDWALHTHALLRRQAYAKRNCIDCYVRDDAAGHAKISGGHRKESTRWVRRLAQLVETGLEGWDPVPGVIQHLQVGFHYWCALQLSIHHRQEALQYWKPFRRHPLVSWWVYQSGVLHLLIRKWRGFHRGAQLLRRWTWPKDLFIQFGSPTFHTTPTGEADPTDPR